MATLQTTWHGTPDESEALVRAVARNCECGFVMGVRVSTCLTHEALVRDQRWLDGLVCMRRYWAKRTLDGTRFDTTNREEPE